MFYNARWYDPTLGRFAQADSLVHAGVQGWDRYAYVNNNPLSYTDPTGHIACIDGEQCGRPSSGGNIGGSGSNDDPSSLQDFEDMSWSEREAWLRNFAESNGLGDWFDDMLLAIEFMMNNPSLSQEGGTAEVMDAAVLQAILDGWNGDRSGGGAGWADFFKEYRKGGDQNHLIVTRLSAEQQGVDYAWDLADTQSAFENSSAFDQGFFHYFKKGVDNYRKAAIKFRSDSSAVSGAEDSLYLGPLIITMTDPRTSGRGLVWLGKKTWDGYNFFH